MVDGGSFLTGTVFGFFLAYFVLAYFLLGKEANPDAVSGRDEATAVTATGSDSGTSTTSGGILNGKENEEKKSKNPPREKDPSAEERAFLDKAIVELNGDLTEVIPCKDKSKASSEASLESASSQSLVTKEMVLRFTTYSAEAKARQRHIKAFTIFLDELGKVHGNFGKALLKVSKLAESHVVGANAFLDKWWNSLAIALDHMSQDQTYVCSALCVGIKDGMMSVETEHDHLEKNIHTEGSKLLNKLREVNDVFTTKKKEFERVRDKLATTAVSSTPTPTPTSQISSPTSPTSFSTQSSSKSAFSTPKTRGVLSTPTSTSTPTPKSAKYEAALKEATEATARLTACQKDFDEKMPRMLADYELMASNGQSSMMALLIKVTNLLTEVQHKSDQVTDRLKMDLASSAAKGSSSQTGRHNYNPVIQELLEDIARHGVCRTQMDMTLESSAGVASSLFTHLPSLPPQFQDSIAKETCVWFNAFNGRIYRDAARSEYFNNWFCVKVAHLLNKGNKSPLIDDYHVSDVSFGSLPPLIRNIQWIPITKDASPDPAAAPRARDMEYDIDCTADVAFRSGLSFTVTTRLWINWPVEKYAFIPMTLKLECTELCGKVRFGVMKQHSFLSFVGEPFTRFSVKSEVGDQYKLKNLPKISNVVINKIKKHIRNKLVYPNYHKFRLMWPKKWWPDSPLTAEDSGRETHAKDLKTDNPTSNKMSTNTDKEKASVGHADQPAGDKTSAETPTPSEKLSPKPTETPKRSWSTWLSYASTKNKILRKDHEDDDDVVDNEDDDDDEAKSSDSDDSDDDSDNDVSHLRSVKAVNQPDHVRLYVSALLRRASKKASGKGIDGYAQDDILIRDKNPSESSIAIVRARSHSISEFRHAALEVMWGEFLGSIGHDFSALSPAKGNDIINASKRMDLTGNSRKAPSPPKSATVRHRRRRILAGMRDRLLGKHTHAHSHSNSNSAGASTSISHVQKSELVKPSHEVSTLVTETKDNTRIAVDKPIVKRERSDDSHAKPSISSPSTLTISSSDESISPSVRVEKVNQDLVRPPTPLSSTTSRHTPSPIVDVDMKINGKKSDSPMENNVSKQHYPREETELAPMNDLPVSAPYPQVKSVALRDPSVTMPVSESTMPSSSTPTVSGAVVVSTSKSTAVDPSKAIVKRVSAQKPTLKAADGYRNRLSLVVGSLRKAATTPSKCAPKPEIDKEEYDAETRAMQEEAMRLTWQAHAEAITVSAINGEHPSMQNFMKAPQQSADKCWVVLKKGQLFIYPNNAKHGKDIAMDAVQPLRVIPLYGCSCRPMEQSKNGFEVGVVNLTTDRTLNQIELSRLEVQRWVPFYTDMEEQCRVWIMAIQFSATMHRFIEKEDK